MTQARYPGPLAEEALAELSHPPQAVACGKKLGNGVIYMKNPMTDRGVLDSTWGGTLADGLGLYQGFSLREPGQKAELIELALQEYDLLFLGAGPDSVRLRPHLNVTERDIGELGRRLDAALARVGRA
jgi:L-lysine 6-transaminase